MCMRSHVRKLRCVACPHPLKYDIIQGEQGLGKAKERLIFSDLSRKIAQSNHIWFGSEPTKYEATLNK